MLSPLNTLCLHCTQLLATGRLAGLYQTDSSSGLPEPSELSLQLLAGFQPEGATWRNKSRVAALLSGYSRKTESLHQSPLPGNPLDVALTVGSANGSHPLLRNGKGSQVLFTLLKLSSNYPVGICLLFLPGP